MCNCPALCTGQRGPGSIHHDFSWDIQMSQFSSQLTAGQDNGFPPPSQAGPSDNWRHQVACPKPHCNPPCPSKPCSGLSLTPPLLSEQLTQFFLVLPHTSPYTTALGLLTPIALFLLQRTLKRRALSSALFFFTPHPKITPVHSTMAPTCLQNSIPTTPCQSSAAQDRPLSHCALGLQTPKGTKKKKRGQAPTIQRRKSKSSRLWF